MFKWIMNKIDNWRFEREFQKRKKELMELDPFIYDIPEEVTHKDPTRLETWESKSKNGDF